MQEPNMKVTYAVGLKPQKVDGGPDRQPGQLVPEFNGLSKAALVPLLREGYIFQVLVATLPKKARHALACFEAQRDGRPIPSYEGDDGDSEADHEDHDHSDDAHASDDAGSGTPSGEAAEPQGSEEAQAEQFSWDIVHDEQFVWEDASDELLKTMVDQVEYLSLPDDADHDVLLDTAYDAHLLAERQYGELTVAKLRAYIAARGDKAEANALKPDLVAHMELLDESDD